MAAMSVAPCPPVRLTRRGRLVVLLAFVLLAAGRRVAHGRMVLRPTARESIVGRNSGALVVPAMILLGWVGVVIGFVVLR